LQALTVFSDPFAFTLPNLLSPGGMVKITWVFFFFAASATAPNAPIASPAIASMARNLPALIDFCRPSLP
jgi:hypothetical protein